MDVVSSRLAAFASTFTQERRLFSLRFTQSHLDTELLPHTLGGEEHVSAPFRLAVECLSDNARIELKSLLGLGVDIAIQLSDGGERVLSGIVMRAQQLGSDGGFARYGLTVEPAFSALKLRRNSRVFQDKTVVDIVGLILDEHIHNNPVFAQCFRYRERLTATYPPRSYCQQYRESDFAFIERLLREEGISYLFDGDHSESDVGLHTLVLFDSGSELAAASQSSVRFHRADATEADDTLTDWTAHRQIQAGAVQLASFDYEGVYTQQGSESSAVDQGERGSSLVAVLTDYSPQGAYYGANDRELNRYATLQQHAADLATKRFVGSGVVRALGAGQWFALNDHPAHDDDAPSDRQFVVLSQTLVARNNLPGEFDSRPALFNARMEIDLPELFLSEPGYKNQFTAVRKTVPIVPAYAHTQHAKPTACGLQSATVVGPAGEEIFTDALGRIKIQFHWARPQDHEQQKHGASAEHNDFSSCWVRVLMPSAGAGYGHQFIPRIGQEVLVDFIEGDIDRPIVIRTIHNGQHTSPTFQNAGALPANKTLSGIKSREYKGARHNEIIFDDTTNEIRTSLSTEHGKTQLNQGYLIHPRTEGKGTPRGEGFELRTDHAGAIRAAQGLLITTEAQPNANGQQLDRENHTVQLQAAQHLTQQLGDTAKGQNANAPSPDPLLDTNYLKDKKPHLVLHGHGGTVITTPQAAVIAAGKDLNQVSQRDFHQTAGRRWIHNVGESISLFVANAENKLKDSIKLLAAKGNILVQAQSDDVDITADKKIAITAAKEKLTATAGQELLLQSGGGYIRISGGNVEIHCPKTLSMKAKNTEFIGAVSVDVAPPKMPNAASVVIAAVSLADIPMPELAKIAENGATKLERRTARKAVIAGARKSAENMPQDKKAATLATADRFERNIDAVEKAKLCQNIYLKDKPDNKLNPEELALKKQGVEGFKPIDNAEDLKKYGLKPADMSPENTNFRAALYEPEKNIFGEGAKPVLVFKGTENMEDWKNNLLQGVGRKSSYFERAKWISGEMADRGIDFETSGHSLGGGLASSAAQVSGVNSTTFNSSGLHKNTVPTDALSTNSNPSTKIQAYRLDGELLTYLQEDAFVIRRIMVSAVGEKISIPNNNPSASRLDRHGMDHVIPAMEKQKTEDLHALVA